MSQTGPDLQEAFLALYRDQVLHVYRYHLLRCGDWQEAQSMTAETFRRAQRWFSRRQAQDIEAHIWLFQIAVGLYTRFRRPPSAVGPGEDDLTPSQEQLAQFAQVAELHEQWRGLSAKRQDANALFLFAGLAPADVARVIGWQLEDVLERIQNAAAEQYGLRTLVEDLKPVGYFTGWLEAELRERALKLRRGWLPQGGPGLWRLRYRAGPFLSLMGQVLPILLLVGAIIWGMNLLAEQTAPALSLPQPTGTQQPFRREGNAPVVSDLQFPESNDSALLVSADGAVYRYDLTFKNFTRLTPDHFLMPGTYNPAFPPQVSPDGYWLALVDIRDGFTWLFSTDGASRNAISPRSLRLAWAPDSKKAAYVLEDDPGVLNVIQIPTGSSFPLARLPGEIQSVAWSPDGRNIGVVYTRPSGKEGTVLLVLGLLDSQGSHRLVLASFEETVDSTGKPQLLQNGLRWTDDRSELWFLQRMVAVNVDAGLISELSTTQSDAPVGKFAGVPLRPLTAQPFVDRFGLQQGVLFGQPAGRPDYTGNPVAVSPDRSFVAMAFRNPNGAVGTLAVQRGASLDERLWIQNLGEIGKVSWTLEGNNLLVAQYFDSPGRILRVVARSGEYRPVAEGYWMLGTLSDLMAQSRSRAPQTYKIPLSGPDLSGPTVSVGQGLGFQLDVPAHWRVWQLANSDPNGWLTITNFDFSDPLGYTSLSADDIVIYAAWAPWAGADLERYIEQIRQSGGESRVIEPFDLNGHPGYRVTSTRPDQSPAQSVYIKSERGVFYLGYYPAATTRAPVFERILSSLRFEDERNSAPTQPSGDLSSVAWERYHSLALGVMVDIPASYKRAKGCGVQEAGGALQVGSRIILSKASLGGQSLRAYVDEAMQTMQPDWQISRTVESTLPAGKAIFLEGSYSSTGLFVLTYIQDGGDVLVLSYSPKGSCDLAVSGISELQVYWHMAESLEFIRQIP